MLTPFNVIEARSLAAAIYKAADEGRCPYPIAHDAQHTANDVLRVYAIQQGIAAPETARLSDVEVERAVEHAEEGATRALLSSMTAGGTA